MGGYHHKSNGALVVYAVAERGSKCYRIGTEMWYTVPM